MIEGVKELHPQLDFHSFVQADVLTQSQVRIVNWVCPHVGKTKREGPQVVHRCGTVCRARWRGLTGGQRSSQDVHKRIRVEPVGKRPLAIGDGYLSTQVESITCERHREARLVHVGSLDLPAADDRVDELISICPKLLTLSKRQRVEATHGEPIGNVLIGDHLGRRRIGGIQIFGLLRPL